MKSVRILFLSAVAACPAAAASPSGSPLAECQLPWPEANAQMQTLPKVRTDEDLGAALEGGDLAAYDTRSIRALGVGARSMQFAESSDRGIGELTTVIPLSYAKARGAMLQSLGVTSCDFEETYAGERSCTVRKFATNRGKPIVVIQENDGKTEIVCRY